MSDEYRELHGPEVIGMMLDAGAVLPGDEVVIRKVPVSTAEGSVHSGVPTGYTGEWVTVKQIGADHHYGFHVVTDADRRDKVNNNWYVPPQAVIAWRRKL